MRIRKRSISIAVRADEAEHRGVNHGFADTLRHSTTAAFDLTS